MNTVAISLVVILILFTIALSIFSRRFTRTTADFYLAGRKVGSFTNASAISGDYLSAASFLGVAGAVYASGLDGVWYAAGFAGGFMVVVLFIASPLRRFGEYTVADFAFGRFGTSRMRLLTVLAVLLTSLFYMAPQMYGAGTTWQVLVGTGIFGMDPYTSGVVVVSVIMMFYVAVGGMKGTTLNQVFQFWWLWFAMFLVVIFSFGSGFNYSDALQQVSYNADGTGKKLVATKTMTIAELTAPIKNPQTGEVVVGRRRQAQDRVRQREGDHAARVRSPRSRRPWRRTRVTRPGRRPPRSTSSWLRPTSCIRCGSCCSTSRATATTGSTSSRWCSRSFSAPQDCRTS